MLAQELEKLMILNSHRLRTFEDARLEIVTCVEAKFGLRIRDSKPSDTGSRTKLETSSETQEIARRVPLTILGFVMDGVDKWNDG